MYLKTAKNVQDELLMNAKEYELRANAWRNVKRAYNKGEEGGDCPKVEDNFEIPGPYRVRGADWCMALNIEYRNVYGHRVWTGVPLTIRKEDVPTAKYITCSNHDQYFTNTLGGISYALDADEVAQEIQMFINKYEELADYYRKLASLVPKAYKEVAPLLLKYSEIARNWKYKCGELIFDALVNLHRDFNLLNDHERIDEICE